MRIFTGYEHNSRFILPTISRQNRTDVSNRFNINESKTYKNLIIYVKEQNIISHNLLEANIEQ